MAFLDKQLPSFQIIIKHLNVIFLIGTIGNFRQAYMRLFSDSNKAEICVKRRYVGFLWSKYIGNFRSEYFEIFRQADNP